MPRYTLNWLASLHDKQAGQTPSSHYLTATLTRTFLSSGADLELRGNILSYLAGSAELPVPVAHALALLGQSLNVADVRLAVQHPAPHKIVTVPFETKNLIFVDFCWSLRNGKIVIKIEGKKGNSKLKSLKIGYFWPEIPASHIRISFSPVIRADILLSSEDLKRVIRGIANFITILANLSKVLQKFTKMVDGIFVLEVLLFYFTGPIQSPVISNNVKHLKKNFRRNIPLRLRRNSVEQGIRSLASTFLSNPCWKQIRPHHYMTVPLNGMFEKSIETTYNKTDTSSPPRTG